MYIIRMDPSRIYGTGRGDAVISYIELSHNDGTLCGRFHFVKDARIMAQAVADVTRKPMIIKVYYLDGSVGVGTYQHGERFEVPGRPLKS